jgi:hypothetical protein
VKVGEVVVATYSLPGQAGRQMAGTRPARRLSTAHADSYVTTGDIVADETGMSGVRLMFSFSRDRSMRRARRRSVLVLLSPRRWRRVLIATGWPAVPVGVILLDLLATDLVSAFTALPGLGSRSTS